MFNVKCWMFIFLKRGSAQGIEVAWRTLSNHLEKVARLYEQGADADRIGQYIKGWWQWVRAGIDLLGAFGLDIKMYWHYLVKQLGGRGCMSDHAGPVPGGCA